MIPHNHTVKPLNILNLRVLTKRYSKIVQFSYFQQSEAKKKLLLLLTIVGKINKNCIKLTFKLSMLCTHLGSNRQLFLLILIILTTYVHCSAEKQTFRKLLDVGARSKCPNGLPPRETECVKLSCETACDDHHIENSVTCQWKIVKRGGKSIATEIDNDMAKDCLTLLKIQDFWNVFKKNPMWANSILHPQTDSEREHVAHGYEPKPLKAQICKNISALQINPHFVQLHQNYSETAWRKTYSTVLSDALTATRTLIAAVKLKHMDKDDKKYAVKIPMLLRGLPQSIKQYTRSEDLRLAQYIPTDYKLKLKKLFDRLFFNTGVANSCQRLFDPKSVTNSLDTLSLKDPHQHHV